MFNKKNNNNSVFKKAQFITITFGKYQIKSNFTKIMRTAVLLYLRRNEICKPPIGNRINFYLVNDLEIL